MDVREVERLIDVETEEETIRVIKAMTQLYRENAKYLDRIYKWMNKVGMDWIRERISDPVECDALAARFDLSQTVYQKDPWAEHAQKKAANYRPVANLTLEAAE